MVVAPPLPLSDRPEFGPPPNARSWRALALAVAAHLLLVLALTWGANWKNSDEAAAFSAELWTGQPPPQIATPPEPPSAPKPLPAPPPTPPAPAPAPLPPPPKVEAPQPEVDIALEQAKKRALLRQQQAAEDRAEQKAADLAAKKQAKLREDQNRLQEEKARLKAEQAADKAQAVKLKAQETARQAATQAAKEAAREAAEDAKEAKEAKQAREAKGAKEAQRKQDAQQKQAAAAAVASKAQRDANMARLNAQLGSAGAAGTPRGTAAQGSGGSTTYGAIVKSAIKPNVVFGEDITGNPMAKIEVRLTLDGTIISQRLIASSGNKAWDDAAMNGITRTRVMPRDVDGRIPDTTLILEMRPKN